MPTRQQPAFVGVRNISVAALESINGREGTVERDNFLNIVVVVGQHTGGLPFEIVTMIGHFSIETGSSRAAQNDEIGRIDNGVKCDVADVDLRFRAALALRNRYGRKIGRELAPGCRGGNNTGEGALGSGKIVDPDVIFDLPMQLLQVRACEERETVGANPCSGNLFDILRNVNRHFLSRGKRHFRFSDQRGGIVRQDELHCMLAAYRAPDLEQPTRVLGQKCERMGCTNGDGGLAGDKPGAGKRGNILQEAQVGKCCRIHNEHGPQGQTIHVCFPHLTLSLNTPLHINILPSPAPSGITEDVTRESRGESSLLLILIENNHKVRHCLTGLLTPMNGVCQHPVRCLLIPSNHAFAFDMSWSHHPRLTIRETISWTSVTFPVQLFCL